MNWTPLLIVLGVILAFLASFIGAFILAAYDYYLFSTISALVATMIALVIYLALTNFSGPQ